jgi:carboxyl-terminal processing protease
VGIQTFGKGVVQTVFPLAGGSGAAITTHKYLTPSGRSIHKIGLTPEVAAGSRLEGKPVEQIRRVQDEQLTRGIEVLRARLS